MSDIEWKVLGSRDVDEILLWERERLRESPMEESGKLMAEWTAHWRRESLEHYLPLGWSMAARRPNGELTGLAGYFLAQPFLFFQGHTQILWIERLAAEEPAIQRELIDIAYRMSREKHLQAILFGGRFEREAFARYKDVVFNEGWVEIPTTKRG